MRTAKMIIAAFETGRPVHIGGISWNEFIEMLSTIKSEVEKQK